LQDRRAHGNTLVFRMNLTTLCVVNKKKQSVCIYLKRWWLLRVCFLNCNGFDLIDVSTTICTPIATPTVVEGDLFFRQGGDQLNDGKKGDVQPIITTVFSCTIVVHRRLGADQCDGGTTVCRHSTQSTLANCIVGKVMVGGGKNRKKKCRV
jgi:hypothetical protein